MVLPHFNMNPSRAYTCSPSWTPLPLPSHTIPPGHPSAPAPSILYQTWTGDSFLIWYYTCFHDIPPNHPTLSLFHRVQKTVLYICVSFAVLQRKLSLHLSKFHIYDITPCNSVEAADWKLCGDLVGLLGPPQPPALATLTLAWLPTKEEAAFSNVSMYALKK